MELELLTLVALFGVALIAGFIDAIAGGGGLVTMPALLLTGVPPHMALGANKFSACLGTCVALGNFARSNLVLWRVALAGLAFGLATCTWALYATPLILAAAGLPQVIAGFYIASRPE